MLQRFTAEAIDGERLIEEPHRRGLLCCLRYYLVAGKPGGFAGLIEVDARDIQEDIGDVAQGLIGDAIVERLPMLRFFVSGEPLSQMPQDVLEVLQPQRARSDGIIGQILLDGRGVVATVTHLL